ncbi:MAG TPA: ABC transporter ATP-binding protein [Bacteroidia bacterium]|nr:ABC transporter ATP-binding protein [Bacteroidia bacterium]
MKSLWSLNHYFLKYKWLLLLGILFVSLSTIFGTYQAVIVRKGTNTVLKYIAENNFSDTSIFITYGLTIIGLALTSGLFMFLMRQTIIVMSRHIEYDQKNEIYKHYQALDVTFYKKYSTGDLMNRITEDVSRVRMYTGPAVMYLANTFVTVITVLIFMLNVNWQLTLMVFIPLPALSFIIYRVSDVLNKRSNKVQQELSNLTSHTQESFASIRVIKAYAQEKFFTKSLDEKGGVYKKENLKLARIESYFQPTMGLMIGLSILITIWYGGYLVMEKKIEAGNIPEFITYVYRLTWPFAALGWVTSLIQRAAASQTRINEFLKTPSAIKNNNFNPTKIKGDIKFENVSFTYPETGITALKNISFHVKQGEVVGITGPVGSGKSTLTQLLSRVYDTQQGEILIDDANIKQLNLFDLRKATGVVPQEVFLYSDTISNNISFASEKEFSKKEIAEAAKNAAVYDNIESFPNKFETMVGERGITLSGGQKQRISIARAIIKNPEILIFDDCLSAVDTETESLILTNLRRLMQNKTSIIVSPRISSIRHADKILYLKNGEITESGTHQELLNLKGEYYSLFELQKN